MSLYDKIPNNVDLSSNKKLQKALEAWQPNFIDWWKEMGPSGFQEDLVYLRTAVSVEHDGWAHFDYVKMPDYRWGIFLTPREGEKKIGFGDHAGEDVWNEVPGEMRKDLRRIIVTQGDTEPASVEQQRLLGNTCPSLYDLRNLFQVNIEEGRHLWAMVHLLHEFFGRDGREEADEMLERRSGHTDNPRILGAFNKPCEDWLSFFCFTMFTDRDGKYQLAALAESAFDPLARATQFMLTEEAHHLFVGETGLRRVVQRTCELMKEAPEGDVTKVGGIPLDTLQKYINEWYSASIDLFGGEDSSNAATYFASSIKGRFKEMRDKEISDHVALDGAHNVDRVVDGKVVTEEIPLRRAMNLVLRESYTADCERAVRGWNRTLEKAGVEFRLKLPSPRFNRDVGLYDGLRFDPDGNLMSEEQWNARFGEFLPSEADRTYVKSLMQQVTEPGKFANWIAPPSRGINDRPLDHKYVMFSDDPEYAKRA
jgi:benzoyl-CoA 2,3-dioxygenase component B